VDRQAYIESPLEIAAELTIVFSGKQASIVFDIGSCE